MMSRVLEATPPHFTVEDAERIAARLQIDGTATSLGSERDQAFLLDSGHRPLILKISNAAEQEASLDFEAEAIAHLLRADPDLPVARPRVVSEGPGPAAFRTTAEGPDGMHYVRVFEHRPGTEAVEELSDCAVAEYGRAQARLDLALRGFFHPAAGRHLLWDLAHCSELRPLVASIPDERRRRVVEAVLDRYEERVTPRWRSLRAQVIHGDFTFDNVLFDDAGRISGIIDFGDSSFSAQVADLAISLLSLIRNRPDEEIFRIGRIGIDGYASLLPLEPEEFEVLGDLVAARLAITVVISAWRLQRYPENERYITRWDEDAWRLLEFIDEFGLEEFGYELGAARPSVSSSALAERRARVLGPMLEDLSYSKPLHPVRGDGVWLYDADGNRLLDTYNNVPVVGHCHPRVTEAVVRQTRALNTHARYLYEPLVVLGERLLASMPTGSGLDCVLIVNSGSEANDIAWRIATAATGHRGAIVTEDAYHGVTAMSGDLSPEQWPSRHEPGGVERLPAALDRAAIGAAARRLESRGDGLAATYIDAACTSDGIWPVEAERMRALIDATHLGGGLFVADEVQVGFGRSGEHLWNFTHLGATPDFVTLGKPMGNGYPVAALLTRAELVDAAGLTRRLFSTFGGNPVAAQAANAVLDVIEDERIVPQVKTVSTRLCAEIEALRARHPEIAEVRNLGLLVGVELGDGAHAKRVVDAMRDAGVLIGRTAPGGEVLKIRPPLVFGPSHVDLLISALDAALSRSA